MNRIDALFTRLKSEGRTRLMPFITAGDPDLPTTAPDRRGGRPGRLVEIGIPYSDPIADGPVISASYHRALAQRGPARRRSPDGARSGTTASAL